MYQMPCGAEGDFGRLFIALEVHNDLDLISTAKENSLCQKSGPLGSAGLSQFWHVNNRISGGVSREQVRSARAPAPLQFIMPLAIELITLLLQNHTLIAEKYPCSATVLVTRHTSGCSGRDWLVSSLLSLKDFCGRHVPY